MFYKHRKKSNVEQGLDVLEMFYKHRKKSNVEQGLDVVEMIYKHRKKSNVEYIGTGCARNDLQTQEEI